MGDAGGMANMAAKLGALCLANEHGQNSAPVVDPTSVHATATSQTLSGKKDLVSQMVSRAGPSSVQAKTAPKAPKHTVAAPKRKKQILPVALINKTKCSLPEVSAGAPRQGPIKYPKQPLITSSPGP